MNGNISEEICSLLIFPGRYLLLFSTLFITNHERKLRRWNTEGVIKTLDHPPQGTFSTTLSPSCTKHDKLSYSPTRTQGESDRYRSRQVVIFWYGKFSHQLEFARCQGAPYKQRSSVHIKGTWYNFRSVSKRSLGSSFFLHRSAGEVINAHVICDGFIWK